MNSFHVTLTRRQLLQDKLKVVVGAHVKIVVSLPCSLEKSTQDDVKQTLKEVIAVVRVREINE